MVGGVDGGFVPAGGLTAVEVNAEFEDGEAGAVVVGGGEFEGMVGVGATLGEGLLTTKT